MGHRKKKNSTAQSELRIGLEDVKGIVLPNENPIKKFGKVRRD
jgi:hypothetical protein